MATISSSSDTAKSFLRRAALFVGVLVVLGIVFSSCMTRVDAAHVGIKIKLAGTD